MGRQGPHNITYHNIKFVTLCAEQQFSMYALRIVALCAEQQFSMYLKSCICSAKDLKELSQSIGFHPNPHHVFLGPAKDQVRLTSFRYDWVHVFSAGWCILIRIVIIAEYCRCQGRCTVLSLRGLVVFTDGILKGEGSGCVMYL